jgi:small subunit ribosomal protein S13
VKNFIRQAHSLFSAIAEELYLFCRFKRFETNSPTFCLNRNNIILKYMPRIAGVNIPDNKRIEIALTYVYGIGRVLSNKILTKAKVDPNIRANKLTAEEVNRLRDLIEREFKIEGDLKREKMMNVKRLKDIGCYRGVRHMKGLPSRGQRTKTNTRTIRGNVRKTMGSGRKKPTEKT